MPPCALPAALIAAVALLAPAFSLAQVTLKPDGQWRYLLTAGANVSSGNNRAGSVNLAAEGARQTGLDKWTWGAKADHARSAGATTTERYDLQLQYNRDISPGWFGFGTAGALRDKLANIGSRYQLASGVGHHVWADDDGFFDVFAGLGYTYDRYLASADVAGALRDTYGRLELMLTEESSHKLTRTTSLRQKVSLYTDLHDRGKYRAVLDTGLTVAMTPAINLSLGLSYRYDNDPGTALKKGDAMFVTGVSLRFD